MPAGSAVTPGDGKGMLLVCSIPAAIKKNIKIFCRIILYILLLYLIKEFFVHAALLEKYQSPLTILRQSDAAEHQFSGEGEYSYHRGILLVFEPGVTLDDRLTDHTLLTIKNISADGETLLDSITFSEDNIWMMHTEYQGRLAIRFPFIRPERSTLLSVDLAAAASLPKHITVYPIDEDYRIVQSATLGTIIVIVLLLGILSIKDLTHSTPDSQRIRPEYP